jgi:3-deoxy-manno-octulosonate cytidylyltransferase (CMP-KDO synthetase)
MNVLGIIPARYNSSRLPGKPLADIGGKSMIQRVYEQANKAFTSIVATDDERIMEAVKQFGGKAILTAKAHETGTNRCLEAYSIYKEQTKQDFDVVVNIQGDEPFIDPKQLALLTSCFTDTSVKLATLVKKVSNEADLINENRVFVTFTQALNALYFSRSVIPFVRNTPKEEWLEHATIYKHIGLYAYTPQALHQFANMASSSLEIAESLEQNRWLQNGGEVKIAITDVESQSVDTPADLEAAREIAQTRL